MTSIPALKEMLEGEPGKIPNENLDQHKNMKSTRNDNYVGKYKRIYLII